MNRNHDCTRVTGVCVCVCVCFCIIWSRECQESRCYMNDYLDFFKWLYYNPLSGILRNLRLWVPREFDWRQTRIIRCRGQVIHAYVWLIITRLQNQMKTSYTIKWRTDCQPRTRYLDGACVDLLDTRGKISCKEASLEIGLYLVACDYSVQEIIVILREPCTWQPSP